MADLPRKSPVIQVELLFLDGIYIFHHRDKEIPEADVYKSISPNFRFEILNDGIEDSKFKI
ncbi:hypothetical protein [Nostoc sp.]|uniref:hypothetical protein n=1 Tax=Nostoc sp. TaxID=1180 RepID=UPI002FF9AA8C